MGCTSRVPAPDPSWDFLQPESKARVLDGLRAELGRVWSLLVEPAHWTSPTACDGWETRDLAGHLLDAVRGYLEGFDAVTAGVPVATVPADRTAEAYDEAARAFRSTPREEVLDLLRADSDRLLARFESLSAEDWTGLVVTDRYAGPLPAAALATGILAGCAVHGWDLARGRGRSHPLDGEVAELLVPFVLVLWAFTADTSAVDAPFELGVRVSGRTGGDHRVTVAPDGITAAAAETAGCPAVLEVDPGTLVLIAYDRVDAGTVHGDRAVVDRFRSVLRHP